MNASERLRKLRTGRRLTLNDAARQAGISGAYLSDLERGNRRVSAAVIGRLIPVYALAVDEIEDIIRDARDEQTAALDDLLDREYKRLFPREVSA